MIHRDIKMEMPQSIDMFRNFPATAMGRHRAEQPAPPGSGYFYLEGFSAAAFIPAMRPKTIAFAMAVPVM